MMILQLNHKNLIHLQFKMIKLVQMLKQDL